MASIASHRTAASAGAPVKARPTLNIVRWGGAAGLVAALILLLLSPLYFMAGTPPPVSDAGRFADYLARNRDLAVTTKLVDTVYVAAFTVFLVGIRELIRRRDPEYDWAATLAFAGGLAMSIVILVGDVLGAGAAIDTYSNPNPAVIRALTEASLPAFGAMSLAMTVLFLIASCWGILGTQALPRWTGWMGCGVAVINMIAVGTIFGGNDFLNTTVAGGSASAGLYSHSYAAAGATLEVWLLFVGFCMIRAGRRRAEA